MVGDILEILVKPEELVTAQKDFVHLDTKRESYCPSNVSLSPD